MGLKTLTIRVGGVLEGSRAEEDLGEPIFKDG